MRLSSVSFFTILDLTSQTPCAKLVFKLYFSIYSAARSQSKRWKPLNPEREHIQ